MVKSNYIPERGDIVWADFNPARGHEQAGRRPAFVVSPFYYNQKSGLVIICPITSQVKGYPFEVLIKEPEVSGVILVDHLRSVDIQARRLEFLVRAGASVVQEFSLKLRALLG